MDRRYDFRLVEEKWQKRWIDDGLFVTDPQPGKPKYYVLEMYPYPSGSGLHMGNTRVYAIGDVFARYKILRGYNVIHPMGFDSFGLPAENAAIKQGADPGPWTEKNIEYIREQITSMGFSYDWRREVACHRPDYYKWTQWIFKLMFERGLAYQKDARVNYCPNCETVLANEQAEGGVCERCDSEIEIRKLKQWYFKTTEYAERLLDDLAKLEAGWPERVVEMQRKWIGRSEGCMISFEVPGFDEDIEVFTTRPDTLYGCTYMVLAPEHPFVEKLTAPEKIDEVREFVKKCVMQSEIERTSEDSEKVGMHLGMTCINPINGREIPILIGNYVLAEYGTGAVMCVPAHDTRDFMFATRYELPIIRVIKPEDSDIGPDDPMEEAYTESGVMVNCGDEYDGMKSTEFWGVVADRLNDMDKGGRTINYRLRDWLISRQRYWGAPIPIIHCEKCGQVAVPDEDLPVLLPDKDDVDFVGGEGSPLASAHDWLNVKCPKCGGEAKRETDTMDTFVDSSWYFLRYCSPDADDVAFRKDDVAYWCPMDLYIGGPEHAIMHLMYFRFFTKVLHDAGYLEYDEPAPKLLTQGIVMWGGHKMSKSKGNVEDPRNLTTQYGADTTRLFILFAAPPERDIDWEDHIERGENEPMDTFPPDDYRMTGMEGQYRWLNRIWTLVHNNLDACRGQLPADGSVGEIQDEDIRRVVHDAIKEVTLDIEERETLNTAIARMMSLSNELGTFSRNGKESDPDHSSDLAKGIGVLLRMVSPYAPHIAEECWEALGNPESIFKTPWPEHDEQYLKRETMTIVVQVMGKLRDRIEVPVDISDEDLKEACRTDKVMAHIGDKKIVKEIVVPKKLVNFVAK